MRYDLAKAEYESARRQYEVGAAGRDSMAEAAERYRALVAAVKRMHIDLDEIKVTSGPPRNNLDAPLVGKRDFVRDRLMLDVEAAQHTLAAAEETLTAARSRAAVGLASENVTLRAEAEVAQARERMQLAHSKLELRQRFLRGELKTADLAVSQRRTELTFALERAQREMQLERDLLERLRKQAELGLAGQLEVKRAEIAVLEREIELKRISAELAALRRPR
jgi:hypothetical protein